ncbi:Hypothetical predicted protein [Octopus vulgaris]|uniref:Uncharacterized protein n=1 Tax=Octopus vulgaris TaxID=6645 RepID=A0AA36AMK5_OCTVU|nr:Hypothetical predicted protein [Octopus vulgaris]
MNSERTHLWGLENDRMMALSKEERIPDRMMDLSKEERIELVLLSGREGWSYRKIAEEFNLRHPYSDKATFYVNGEVNRQNLLYWSRGNPHWMDPSKQQGSKKVMVWCDTVSIRAILTNSRFKQFPHFVVSGNLRESVRQHEKKYGAPVPDHKTSAEDSPEKPYVSHIVDFKYQIVKTYQKEDLHCGNSITVPFSISTKCYRRAISYE